jgi:predicted site-specific integrase-resolvase
MKTKTPQTQKPNESPKALMSRQLVAQKLGVSAMTVKRMQNRGMLKPIYLSARSVRYRPEDVENLILEASAWTV